MGRFDSRERVESLFLLFRVGTKQLGCVRETCLGDGVPMLTDMEEEPIVAVAAAVRVGVNPRQRVRLQPSTACAAADVGRAADRTAQFAAPKQAQHLSKETLLWLFTRQRFAPGCKTSLTSFARPSTGNGFTVADSSWFTCRDRCVRPGSPTCTRSATRSG